MDERAFRPLLGLGLVVRFPPPGGGYLGSAFAYRKQGYWVTAAHVVGDLEHDQLGIIALQPHAPARDLVLVGD